MRAWPRVKKDLIGKNSISITLEYLLLAPVRNTPVAEVT